MKPSRWTRWMRRLPKLRGPAETAAASSFLGALGATELTAHVGYTWPSTGRPTTQTIPTVDRIAATVAGVAFNATAPPES